MRYALSSLALLAGCAQDFQDISSGASRDTSPSTANVAQLSSDDASFAFDLFHAEFTAPTANVFFSPYSVSVALGMTYAGAATSTASQMAQALHFTLAPPQLFEAFDAVDLALSSRQGLTLHVANSIWAEQTLPFAKPFLDTLAVDFGSEVRGVDFIHSAPQATNAIDGWVSDRTNGKIATLIPQGALDASTRLVLVNAVYFDANWQTKFDPNATTTGAFTRDDGSTVSASLMHAETLQAAVNTTTDFTAIDIPYAGGQTSLLVVMPAAGTMSGFSTGFQQAALAQMVTGLSPTTVNVTLPKFTLQGQTFSVKAALAALGMTNAFDPTRADFSAMTTAEALHIDDVLHQAFVRVDENGTEAAAATSVGVASLAAVGAAVTIDHPFFFFLRDIPTGTVLFMGRMMDPSQQ